MGVATTVGSDIAVAVGTGVGSGISVTVGSRGGLEQASTKITTVIDRTIRNLNLFLNHRTSIGLKLYSMVLS